MDNRAGAYAAIDNAKKTLGDFDFIVKYTGIAQVDPIAHIAPDDENLVLKASIC